MREITPLSFRREPQPATHNLHQTCEPALFLADNVPQDQIGELSHKRPQAGVFLKQRNHISIQVRIVVVVVALHLRRLNLLLGGL